MWRMGELYSKETSDKNKGKGKFNSPTGKENSLVLLEQVFPVLN